MKIITPINSKRLLFREINLSDTDAIVRWRSDPEVYKYFKNPIKIERKKHIEWLNDIYKNDNTRIDLIALDSNGDRIGVFGLVVNDKTVELNYLVAPEQQHKGYATEGVLCLIEYTQKHYDTKKIIAEIHKDNLASINLAAKLGFKPTKQHGNFEIFEYTMPKMLYFRVDGNAEIGLGHIIRCISIAEAAKKLKYNSTFILSDESSKNIVSSYGFNTLVLNSNWNDLDEEIPRIQTIIRENNINNLLIDSYSITKKYIGSLPCQTTYIDDFAADYYPVDTLICYGAYWKQLDLESKYKNTKLLLGPSYVPLRKEFENVGKKEIHAKIQKVLLLSGGTNPDNILERISDTLIHNTDYNITIVCGVFSNIYKSLRKKYKNNSKVIVVNSATDMLYLMSNTDLAITAGGTTMYELCACGTPAISYSVADNQLNNVHFFNDNGYISYIGDSKTNQIEQNLIQAINYYSRRKIRLETSRRMQALIDGFGADRIAKNMIKSC